MSQEVKEMTVKNALEQKAAGQVAPAKKQPQSIKDWIKVMEPEIKKALPSVITPERFTRMAMTAVSSNAKLAECTPQSFCGAMMQAAQLGLEPNTPLGQAYMIPFRNKGVMECQFQIGYKGLIDLAHRSGEFKNIEAHEVYENDEFDYEYGLEPKLHHKPAFKDRGRVICYYAVYTLVNGGFGFEVMSIEDVQKHAAKFSQAYKSGYGSPWKDNFDEMAKKTLIKKVLKYAPIKTEFVKQVQQDETIKVDLSANMEDEQDTTVWAEYEVVEEQSNVDQETGEVK